MMDDHSQTTPLILYTVRGTPRRARLECVLTTQPVMCRTISLLDRRSNWQAAEALAKSALCVRFVIQTGRRSVLSPDP
ncbi:hypothetical protein K466DRAFT_157403 [Polyporus arcularius HHB13444]|uniref:Uncharacterized protein n=1 Tax=Polyporus arcularius HHB13444 TaxID=1314778 RepID=A0A5C3PDG6_9APHY|nr:hypothetical protein K466DRAFT_157403 [Polyporus arcularius HHB13444]